MLKRFLERAAEKSADPSKPPVVIAALGDSVTQGCMEIDVLDLAGVYHNVLKRKLELEWPKSVFCVINAGVGGESAGQGLKRVERDVVKHEPDLLLLGFCLNDSGGGLAALPKYEENIRRIVEAVRAGCQADIILLTPNFMASRKNARIADRHMAFADNIIKSQNGGVLKAYVEALRKLSKELGAPLADVYAKWEKMERDGVDTTALLVNGLNHPGPDGQALIAETVFELILKAKAS